MVDFTFNNIPVRLFNIELLRMRYIIRFKSKDAI